MVKSWAIFCDYLIYTHSAENKHSAKKLYSSSPATCFGIPFQSAAMSVKEEK